MTHYFNQPLRAPSLLLCTALLAACGSRLTESMKTVVPLHAAPDALVSTPTPYSPAEYRVPEASRVNFNQDAQTAVQDLTY
jgi:hypothetical protein